MLLNVGSGGGAAVAPTGGAGGATAEAPAEEAKKEEKEEGKPRPGLPVRIVRADITSSCRKGGVGRGHGFGSLRLGEAVIRECRHVLGCNYGMADTSWLLKHGLILWTRWFQTSVNTDANQQCQRVKRNPSNPFSRNCILQVVKSQADWSGST